MATGPNPGFLAAAQAAKVKMILDMALDFAAMTRVFSEKSKPQIIRQLEICFTKLADVQDQSAYDKIHAGFCDWLMRNITVAARKITGGRIIPERPSSYGHAAKVFDITVKVYVYYCALPSHDIAQRLLPMMHGALDNQILKHLRRRFPQAGVTAKDLGAVDSPEYQRLQSLVRQEIELNYNGEILPVQYDDITFLRLNRVASSS